MCSWLREASKEDNDDLQEKRRYGSLKWSANDKKKVEQTRGKVIDNLDRVKKFVYNPIQSEKVKGCEKYDWIIKTNELLKTKT